MQTSHMHKRADNAKAPHARMGGLRSTAAGLVAALALSGSPMVVHGASIQTTSSAVSTHAKAFGAAVRRDTKAAAASFKEGAHRVAVAATGVAHEIATAARRGAMKTRAALRGEKMATPAG